MSEKDAKRWWLGVEYKMTLKIDNAIKGNKGEMSINYDTVGVYLLSGKNSKY